MIQGKNSLLEQRGNTMEDNSKIIGESLYRFQSAINEEGSSLEEYIRDNYAAKWISDDLYCVMAIRTAFVLAGSRNFLVRTSAICDAASPSMS